jgi:hypothetical protein
MNDRVRHVQSRNNIKRPTLWNATVDGQATHRNKRGRLAGRRAEVEGNVVIEHSTDDQGPLLNFHRGREVASIGLMWQLKYALL